MQFTARYSLQKIYSKLMLFFSFATIQMIVLQATWFAWKGCSFAIDQNSYVQNAKGGRHTPSTVKLKALFRVSSPFTYLACNLITKYISFSLMFALLCARLSWQGFLGKAVHIMAYGSTPYVGMTPKKNGGHIQSAQMTRSKCPR